MFGQVRFPPRLQLLDPATLGPLQTAIESEFPEVAEEQQITVTIAPGSAPEPTPEKTYRFSTADTGWSARLAPDALTLEASAGAEYTSYERFKELFALVWGAILEQVRPSRLVHQGLRYIDHIEGDHSGQEWAEYINPELLGGLAGPHLSEGLFRAASELRFRRDDGVLLFRHGIVEAGPENQMGYLLDFDYFTQEQSDDLSTGALVERFDVFHELLYSFFRWCVTERALEEFRNADR